MSHTHAFPCIALLFPSFLSIFSAVLFFLFYFLFFFSFLTMAPKKFVPSKNLITRCGSSSSSSSIPSVPNRVQFHDVDSQKDLVENFCDWAIHSECQVILSDFPGISLPSAFSSWGWESLYEKPLKCLGVLL